MLFRDKITEIFYDFDEFLKNNYPTCDEGFSLTNQPDMSLSEIASIEIGYHQSKYKCFNRGGGPLLFPRGNLIEFKIIFSKCC